MTSVGFYHLTKSSLEQALPALLTRSMKIKERGLVLCKDDQQLTALTEALWRITHPMWLPHGCHTSHKKDELPEYQPLWLTTIEENPNTASFLFVVGGQAIVEIGQFKRVFDLFDGNDPDAVKAARERWRSLKESGHDLAYWKQTEEGWTQGG